MNTKPKIIVIYHGNCADGFGAAWAVRQRFGDAAEYFPGVYQDAPPDVTNRNVILVDFSYKRGVLQQMAKTAHSIFVLDHHKSAEEDLHSGHKDGEPYPIVRYDEPQWVGLMHWSRHMLNVDMVHNEGGNEIYAYFDMDRSGAGIAWDFFHPGVERPALINHIEDRDLWRFALPGTREIQANVFSYPYDFEVWDELMDRDTKLLWLGGESIERKHFKDIAELLKVCQRTMDIGVETSYHVPVASLPYTMTSDAGHAMAEGHPFAACYWDTAEGRCFSLRSQDTGLDVSLIAKEYGGGGHARAAGFRVPRSHYLAQC